MGKLYVKNRNGISNFDMIWRLYNLPFDHPLLDGLRGPECYNSKQSKENFV
jgi:hypothetical protein